MNTYLNRSNSLSARSTLRREHSVVIVDAIYFIVNVNGERYTIKTLVANATSKAPGMIGLPHSL